MFMVTGWVGAVGSMNFRCGICVARFSAMSTNPSAESPSPCHITTKPLCSDSILGATVITPFESRCVTDVDVDIFLYCFCFYSCYRCYYCCLDYWKMNKHTLRIGIMSGKPMTMRKQHFLAIVCLDDN